MENWELITDTTLEEDTAAFVVNTGLEGYRKFYLEADFTIEKSAATFVTANGNTASGYCIGMVAYGANLVRLIRMFIDALPTGVVYGHGMGAAGTSAGAIIGGSGTAFFKKSEKNDVFPVTEIRIANSVGNFLAGSRFQIYGLK